jgi:hypothetical protein
MLSLKEIAVTSAIIVWLLSVQCVCVGLVCGCFLISSLWVPAKLVNNEKRTNNVLCSKVLENGVSKLLHENKNNFPRLNVAQ